MIEETYHGASTSITNDIQVASPEISSVLPQCHECSCLGLGDKRQCSLSCGTVFEYAGLCCRLSHCCSGIVLPDGRDSDDDVESQCRDAGLAPRLVNSVQSMLPQCAEIVGNGINRRLVEFSEHLPCPEDVVRSADLVVQILVLQEKKLEPLDGIGTKRDGVSPLHLFPFGVVQGRWCLALFPPVVRPLGDEIDLVILEIINSGPGCTRVTAKAVLAVHTTILSNHPHLRCSKIQANYHGIVEIRVLDLLDPLDQSPHGPTVGRVGRLPHEPLLVFF